MKVGFVGLGHMGSGMAANLLKAEPIEGRPRRDNGHISTDTRHRVLLLRPKLLMVHMGRISISWGVSGRLGRRGASRTNSHGGAPQCHRAGPRLGPAPLEKFYNSLSDEQKARFNRLGAPSI